MTDNRRRVVDLATLAVLVALLGVVLVTLWRVAGDGHPFSAIDEHVHADTQARVHDGGFPRRGDLIGQEVVDDWVCRLGHQTITWEVECGSPDAVPANIPTGKYTAGYIHYPTYFLGGEVFRAGADVVSPDREPVDTYRLYAAAVMALGILVSLVLAMRIGLRGAALAAATFAPVAGTPILVFGTIENPTAAAPLCGALVAGTGLRWVLTGRGFWWLAAASAVAAATAVTASLPTGVFVLACLGAMLQRRRGRVPDTGWEPRWRHVVVLGTILVVPVVVFGAWTSARATVGNDDLYSGYGFESWSDILVGVVFELATPHVPWGADGNLTSIEPDLLQRVLMSVLNGAPFLLSVLVGGALALGAMGALRPTPAVDAGADADADGVCDTGAAPRRVSPLPLLAGACILGMVLYPPLLRLSNAVNVGIDHPVVSRYSISLLPLLVWVALLQVRATPAYGRVLGIVAAGTVLAVCAGAW
ncbi:hypothetical protein [Nocardioides sp. zg-1228]|uniref:hypothetical protein n=1 Tax=Nocardioides sp. zg-1228 TaxID=2763008 RepID=UPI001642E719|nr:hypothetical protein [Nocardioides sp. zg-1228]MBC2933232.1 hypothetical protein [Nocardioides sp. zg-1228]QSF56599.1 hypothetical protein JX575_13300 [Nocardioides sp. zg-1228]